MQVINWSLPQTSGSTQHISPWAVIRVKGISQMDGAFKGLDKKPTGVGSKSVCPQFANDITTIFFVLC